MSADAQTQAIYAARAEEYARLEWTDGPDPGLSLLIEGLAPGADVLDFGCGPGAQAAALARLGHRVSAWDASAEMVALAGRSPGVTARLAAFDDLRETAAFDAVLASFSLLHAPKADMPRHLAAIARALRPGGRLVIALKAGTGESRDKLGRFYGYWQEDEIGALLQSAGFDVTGRRSGEGPGLSGEVAPWFVLRAEKRDDA